MANRNQAISFQSELMIEECCNCGMLFAMSSDFQRRRRDSGEFFYCPSGHSQHYTESTVDKLKRDLKAKDRRLEIAVKDAQRETRRRRALQARVINGVCPDCNRSFTNLRRHMETKHP